MNNNAKEVAAQKIGALIEKAHIAYIESVLEHGVHSSTVNLIGAYIGGLEMAFQEVVEMPYALWLQSKII